MSLAADSHAGAEKMPVLMHADGLPDYLISFYQRGPRSSILVGAQGAPSDLSWHLATSVRDRVSETLLLRTRYAAEEDVPDLLLDDDVLLVSQRMRAAIEPWLKDFEFLPTAVELRRPDAPSDMVGGGERLSNYWWLNSWRRLDLIDWERSVFDPLRITHYAPQGVTLRTQKWKSLVLKTPTPDDEHLFGLAFVYGEQRYISRQLHQQLLGAGLRVKFGPRFLRAPSDPLRLSAVRERLNSPRVGG